MTVRQTASLVQAQKRVDELERELDELNRALASAEADEKSALQKRVDSTAKELDEAKDEVEDQKKEIADRKQQVGKAIATIEKCIDYRRAVMNIFAAAKDKVGGERDPEIVPIARELRDAYEASKEGTRSQ